MNKSNLRKMLVSRNFDELIDLDIILDKKINNKKKMRFDDEQRTNFDFRKVSKRNNNKRQEIQ